MKTGSHQEFHSTQAGGGASPLPATPSIDELTRRVEYLEALLVERGLMIRQPDNGVNPVAFERAVAELARGNRKPLSNYLKRGGKIPTGKTISLDGRGQG